MDLNVNNNFNFNFGDNNNYSNINSVRKIDNKTNNKKKANITKQKRKKMRKKMRNNNKINNKNDNLPHPRPRNFEKREKIKGKIVSDDNDDTTDFAVTTKDPRARMYFLLTVNTVEFFSYVVC